MRRRSVFVAVIIALTVFVTVVFSACTVNEKDSAYKITFYNGETVFSTVETKWGEAVSFPAATPTKESDDNYDYVFLGWANSPDSTQVVNGNVLAYSDMSFYAIFSSQQKDPGVEEKIYFTVTFIDDLTDETIGEIQQVESGSDAVLPEPPDHTADGYIFAGWSGSHENIKRTTTIRALYELNSVTLTRHYLGQSREESVISGSEISTEAPTLSSAFVFEGWFWDEEFTDEVENGNNVMPLVATEIYAKISVNFSTAALTATGDLVYGNSNAVSVSGLMGEGVIEYSYDWSGEESTQAGASDAQKILRDAGEYELGVTVTATYSYNGNVVLTDSVQLSESFEVSKATLIVTLSAPMQITYGTEPQTEVSYNGFKHQDSEDMVELSLSYLDELGNKANEHKLPAGNYTVTCTVGELDNYTVAEIEDITFTVNKKDLTVGFTVCDYTYGDELSDDFALAQFVFDESELAYDDAISALGEPQFEVQEPSYSANYPEVLNKGTYSIKLIGLKSDNYNVIDNTGMLTFTVSPKQALVEAIVSDWTYGENANYSLNIEGVLDGDKAALNASYAFTYNGSPYNPQGARIKAGNYTVTAVYTDNANYAFTDSAAKAFTVHKATVTAQISFTNAEKSGDVWSYVYGVAPEQRITYSGFVDNDEEIFARGVNVVFDDNGKIGNAAMLDAGQYEVLLSGLDDLDNYDYAKSDDKVLLSVSKKSLTVTVELSGESAEFTYGVSNNNILNSFSYTHTELAYGQSLSVALENLAKELISGSDTVTAAMPSVGNYYVTVAFANAKNYDVTVEPMALTIGAAELKIGIEDEQIVYGDKPTKSLVIENFKGTDEDKVQAVLTYTKDGKEFALSDVFEVGEYEIKVSWTNESILANYEWTQPDGTVTVVPKQIILSLTAPKSVTFGTEIEPQYSFDGFVYGENENVFLDIEFIYYLGESEYQPRQFSDKELFDVGQYKAVLDYTNNANYTVVGESELEFAVVAKSVFVADTKVLGRLNNNWNFAPTVSGYNFEGSLQLNATDAGVYTWNESNHDGEISWVDGYSIMLEGQDVTANFVLSYDVSVELTASEFKFVEPDDQSFVYDAQQHTFPISVEGILYEQDAGTEIKVEYSLDGLEFGVVPSFVDVGEYTVYYRISANNYVTKNGSFTVYGNMSTDNTISGIKVRNESYVYDATEHVYDISATATFGAVEVYVNGEFATEKVILIDAGTYVFTFTVRGDENYESVTTTRTVTITKANYTVTENKPIENYVFNGNAQGHGVTIKALENDELPQVSYYYGGETIESLAFVNAGSYTVEWFIAESTNYFEQSGSYEVVIDKAYNEIITQFDDYAFSYDGENHEIDLTATATDGTVTVTYEGTELSGQYTLKNVGEYKFVFTVLESQNYMQSVVTRTVSVYRGDYTIADSADQTDYVFDGNAYGHGITVSAFAGDEIPVVAYKHGGQPIETISFIQAGDYIIEWSIAQSDNYNGASGSFLVRINRFTIAVDAEKTTQSYIYNATAQGKGIAMANVAPDDGFAVYYSEQGYSQGTADFTAQPFSYVNAGVYTVYYRITGDNYTTVTGSYTVTITPKTLTVSGLPSGDVRQDYSEAGYTVPELSIQGVLDVDASMVSLSVSVTKNGANVTEIKNKGLYYVNYNVSINSAVASNYNVNSGSGYYTVTINGIKLSLDASMIETSYAYTGYEQTVDFTAVKIMYGDTELTLEQLQQDDSTTRIEYTASKGTITNEGIFSFTNVIDANGAIVTVYLIVGANSNYASAEVALQLIVNKANYTQGDVPQVQTSEQIMMLGKKLGQVELSESFAWADSNEELQLGANEYKAFYNADPDNYNDYELYIQVVARKEIITLTYTERVEAVLGEINADNYKQTFVVTAYGELDRGGSTALLPSELEGKIIYTVSGASYTVGSTYIVTYSLQFVANDYFELDSGVVTSVTTWFKLKSVLVDGNYYTIEDALKVATSGVAKLIGGATQFTDLSTKAALSQMGTPLYEGDDYYTVKSGVTLVLPINSTDNGTLEIKSDYTKLFTSGTNLYSKLTVSQGITLFVNGTLIVNGARKNGGSGNHMSNTDKAYGYSELVIMEDSTVTVCDGAKLYSYGFSYGDGEIVARSGSTVTEPFCLTGWKGGAISSGIVQKVFPINQYALVNIVCLLRIEYGASYNVRAALSGTVLLSTQYVDVDVEFISTSSSAFIQMTGEGGYIEKYIDTANGDHIFNAHSNVTFNNISINIVVSASTKNLQVPIPGHFKLNLIGCEAIVPSGVKLKFLPGATVTVDEDSSIVVNSGGAVYFYGEQGVTFSEGLTYWQDGNNKLTYPIAALKSVYLVAPTFAYDQTTPARFINSGTVTVRSGGIFAVNAEGAEGAKIIIEAGAKLSDSFDEDYTVYGSNALTTKAAYFTASFEAYGLGNTDFALVADGSYVYYDGDWQRVEPFKYSIVYDANGGALSGDPSQSFTIYITEPLHSVTLYSFDTPDPTHLLGLFNGWYLDAQCTQPIDMSNPLTVSNGDVITVYAGWDKITYTIEYVIEDGANNQEIVNGNATSWQMGEAIELIDIIAQNGEFGGWFADERYQSAVNVVDDELVKNYGFELDGNRYIRIYGAIFDLDKEFAVVYDLNLDGISSEYTDAFVTDLPMDKVVKINQAISEVADADDYNLHANDYDVTMQYYFAGWYVGNKLITDGTVITFDDIVDGKLTLTAKWEQKIELSITVTATGTSGGLLSKGSSKTATYSVSFSDTEYTDSQSATGAGGNAFYGAGKTETKTFSYYLILGQSYTVTATEGSGGASGTASEGDTAISVTVQNS